MRPLRVTAELSTAPAFGHRSGPLLLDAPLLAGLGALLGAADPSGLVPAETVIAAAEAGGLGLARVEGAGTWWWACSAVVPWGPEEVMHLHRRPALEGYRDLTATRSVNVGAGPDKALRVPHYVRPAMRRLTWTCIGDPGRVRELLAQIPGIGKLVGHGVGCVRRWRVEVDPDGPALYRYASDLSVRPIPVEGSEVPRLPRFRRHNMPVRSPYYHQHNAVPCWIIPEAA